MVVEELNKHPILEDAISRLRNKNTGTQEFRTVADTVFELLAFKVTELLPVREIEVETPVGNIMAKVLDNSHRTILVPIIRSGITMLPVFQKWIPNCDIGFIGQERDEVTAKPKEYYFNIPSISQEDSVLVLDPMIATGGSAAATIRALLEKKIEEKQIHIVAVIAAPEGLDLLKETFPEIRITVARIDEKLNDQKFIVPGLGDFGDRYNGTES